MRPEHPGSSQKNGEMASCFHIAALYEGDTRILSGYRGVQSAFRLE